jgi:hypothetical protein
MRFFKDYTFTWWQTGILKIAMVCIGIAIGANWPEVFTQYITILLVFGIALGIYVAAISFKK